MKMDISKKTPERENSELTSKKVSKVFDSNRSKVNNLRKSLTCFAYFQLHSQHIPLTLLLISIK